VALLALLLACGADDGADGDVARGRGLEAAALPAAAQAQVYEAVLRAAFEVEPSLTLLLDPRLLPRTAGLEGGQPVPAELVPALRRRGVLQGTCTPRSDAARPVPRCDARAAGYVVRFSDVFRVAPDSVQVYLAAERYDTPTSTAGEALQFEKVYQLVRQGDRWRVAQEARAPEGGP
jgi:hypothetical protein